MFPGSGGHTYNSQANQGGYNQGYGYNYNSGPGYGPPPGPPGPPGHPGPYQQPSYGPPPVNNYGAPPNMPPNMQQQYTSASGNEGSSGYSRPAAEPQYRGNQGPNSYNAPPMTPQAFGPNTNMQFSYSTCSGRKKALLVGINYFGTPNELRGCINDVKNMSSFLNRHFGYSYDDMVILTDDQNERGRIPTRENIIRAMQWLVKGASPNDSLVFHYSGHGGLTEDLDGDEESGFDGCIYPLDFEQAGSLIDDIMHDIMVKPLPQGCRLTALFDSCHSGTALDLPFVYSTKGVVKEPNMLKDAGKGAFDAFVNYESGNLSGAISSLSGMVKKFTNSQKVDRQQVIYMKASPADVISISGCKDDQTSADATENGLSTGAMSWSFINALSAQPQQSYLSLLNNMRELLRGKYSQKPQLSSSHPQDMNLLFIM